MAIGSAINKLSAIVQPTENVKINKLNEEDLFQVNLLAVNFVYIKA